MAISKYSEYAFSDTITLNKYYMIDVFSCYLKSVGIMIPKSFVTDYVLKHPEHDSLLAISDFCNSRDIPNYACSLSIQDVQEKGKFPFIAYFLGNGGEFVLVKSIDDKKVRFDQAGKTKIVSIQDFAEMWSGIAFYIDPETQYTEPGYWKNIFKEQVNGVSTSLLIFLLAVLVIIQMYMNHSILGTPFIFLFSIKLLGVLISLIIQNSELNENSKLSKLVCSMTKESSCTSILGSKEARLFGLKLSDMEMVYFLSGLVSLYLALIFSQVDQVLSILYLLSLFTTPFIAYSFYTQIVVLKKWCPLCMATVACILLEYLQIFIYDNLLVGFWGLMNVSSITILILSSLFSATLFVVMKDSITSLYNNRKFEYLFYRLKRKSNIFNASYNATPEMDMQFRASEIILGNSSADVRVTFVTNTQCKPCKTAHKAINEVLNANRHDFQLIVRFIITGINKRESLHLMELFKVYGPEVFEAALLFWFENLNYELLVKEYPVEQISKGTQMLMLRTINWFDYNHITSSPTVFLNNKMLNQDYEISDLKWLLYNIKYDNEEYAYE